MEIGQVAVYSIILILVASVPSAFAVVGDVEASHNVNSFMPTAPSGSPGFCQIGLATDGTDLWLNRCGDPLLYCVDPVTGAACGTLDPGIPELPNAMAYDAARGGLWIGTQGAVGGAGPGDCGSAGLMPIYFYDFISPATLEFTIPNFGANPFSGLPISFTTFCFVDGLAYNKADPGTGVDTIYYTDDVSSSVSLFDVTGTIIGGFDALVIDGALGPQSGLAIGGSNLYLGNDGGGMVYRAAIPPLTPLGLFAAIDDRVEDMECDPDSFADEVMWVRSTPQSSPGDNLVTAYEIEPSTCGEGGEPPIMPPPTVGGIFEPIDATAVLAAGVYSSTYWLIPVVLSAVGIGIFLSKRRK